MAALEQEMDSILVEKEREVRSLSLDKKNLSMALKDY